MDENRNTSTGTENSAEQQPTQSAPQYQQPQSSQSYQQPGYQQPQQNYQQTYQQQTYKAPTYQAPNYQSTYTAAYPQVSANSANKGKGGGWIGFMRVMAWVLFAVFELAFVIGGFAMIVEGMDSWYGGDALIWSGIGMIIGGTLMAFLMIAGTMILLDLAKNVSKIATNTAETAAKLDEISRKIEKSGK